MCPHVCTLGRAQPLNPCSVKSFLGTPAPACTQLSLSSPPHAGLAVPLVGLLLWPWPRQASAGRRCWAEGRGGVQQEEGVATTATSLRSEFRCSRPWLCQLLLLCSAQGAVTAPPPSAALMLSPPPASPGSHCPTSLSRDVRLDCKSSGDRSLPPHWRAITSSSFHMAQNSQGWVTHAHRHVWVQTPLAPG